MSIGSSKDFEFAEEKKHPKHKKASKKKAKKEAKKASKKPSKKRRHSVLDAAAASFPSTAAAAPPVATIAITPGGSAPSNASPFVLAAIDSMPKATAPMPTAAAPMPTADAKTAAPMPTADATAHDDSGNWGRSRWQNRSFENAPWWNEKKNKAWGGNYL
jgi:hypothetical protein